MTRGPQARTSDERGGAPVGNSNAAVSGHRQALECYRKGKPFSEIALAEREAIESEISVNGLDAAIEADMLDLAMLASLYKKHVLAVVADQDGVQAETLGRLIRDTAGLVDRARKAKAELRSLRQDKQGETLLTDEIFQNAIEVKAE